MEVKGRHSCRGCARSREKSTGAGRPVQCTKVQNSANSRYTLVAGCTCSSTSIPFFSGDFFLNPEMACPARRDSALRRPDADADTDTVAADADVDNAVVDADADAGNDDNTGVPTLGELLYAGLCALV
mmetsp:Transcript_14846/g.33387  ORF Transcript_14846/g.33387 Transcript_14846/m.33387 type:complete len:128 (-) Transcript_14846:343-726(-)